MSYNHLEFIDNLVRLLEQERKRFSQDRLQIQKEEVVATRDQMLTPFDLTKSIFKEVLCVYKT